MYPSRLGIYIDAIHRVVRDRGGAHVVTHPADHAFTSVFLGEVASHFDSVVLFGRAERGKSAEEWAPLSTRMRLVELPYYSSLRNANEVRRAATGTATRFWRDLAGVDIAWAIGPNPFSVVFAMLAALRRKRVVLGVRQDTVAYYRARISEGSARRVGPGVQTLDWVNRRMGSRTRVVAVGPDIATHYGGAGRRVHVLSPSVVRADQIVSAPAPRDWSADIDLLTVGRLDREKNPLLLVDALAELEHQSPGKFRLTWIGEGTMRPAVLDRARRLGVADRLDLRGWVPFGPELLELYRRAHVFVHVSLTEGVPQVLIEALASGTPIVATDVGGVRTLLAGGAVGVLVPPDDRQSLVGAILRVESDAELRDRMVESGLGCARRLTLETQAEQVAAFIAGERST